MKGAYHGPRWWTLFGALVVIMSLALGVHFAHLSAGELEIAGIAIGILVPGAIGLWIWRNRGEFG